MRCVGRFYTYRLSVRIDGYLNVLFTMWIKNFVGKAGSNIVIHRGTSFFGLQYLYVGDNSIIQKGTSINAHYLYKNQENSPVITIGRNCNIGPFNHITCINKIIINDGVLTGNRVTISDNNHGSFTMEDLVISPADRIVVSKGEVEIGKNVWIGENACILSGVHVGEGSIVAANAVVTHDVPPYSLVAGIPAKLIKMMDYEG